MMAMTATSSLPKHEKPHSARFLREDQDSPRRVSLRGLSFGVFSERRNDGAFVFAVDEVFDFFRF